MCDRLCCIAANIVGRIQCVGEEQEDLLEVLFMFLLPATTLVKHL